MQVTFENVGVGPCPTCQGVGHVSDGTFTFIGDTIQVLAAPAWSMEKLSWLAARIDAARAGRAAPEAVAQEITNEAPELAAILTAFMRRGWTVIQVLVAILAIVGYIRSQANPPADSEAIDKAQHAIVQELQRRPLAPVKPVGKSQAPRKTGAAATRKPRPPKTYGRQKNRRRR